MLQLDFGTDEKSCNRSQLCFCSKGFCTDLHAEIRSAGGQLKLGALSNYIDYEGFGRDIRFDESGVFADNGYVRSNGGHFVDIYDGRIENIPEEYRIQSPNLYVRAAIGRTEKDMER
jgi:hypothetical protein